MKHLYLFGLLLGLNTYPTLKATPYYIASTQTAQDNNSQSQKLLTGVTEKYKADGSIKLTFKGTQEGVLWLDGERFYLNSNGVESWFDGKTQWSYVEQNQEVTISEPNQEELQAINPFTLLNAAHTQFTSLYGGKVKEYGVQGLKLTLTPKSKGDIRLISLIVNKQYEPLLLVITLENGEEQNFRITSYISDQNLPQSAFQFPTAKYPNAEAIDMR